MSRQDRPYTAFISGHLDLTDEEFNKHYEPSILKGMRVGWTFIVGDAKGADALAQQLLRNYGKVIVYHMFDSPRNNAGHRTKGGFKSDKERDEAMTAASDIDIAWVRPGREKSGTAKNLARRKRNP